MIEILSSSTEYNEIPVRHREPAVLRKLAAHLPQKIDKPNYLDPHTKANILLQSHFSRRRLPADLQEDQQFLLENAIRLLQAIVDVISSSGWLTPALAAMELSQMATQALWDTDSSLKQLPHFDDKLIQRAKDAGTESIFEFTELGDDVRLGLLKDLTKEQIADVARACNRYPNIDVKFQLQNPKDISCGGPVSVNVQLEREGADEDTLLNPVFAPYYPKEKQENWWLVIGEPKTNQLLSIKRLVLQHSSKIKLDFVAPATPGKYKYILYFMCDSYIGCDQEYELDVNVAAASKSNKTNEDEEMTTSTDK